MQRYCITNLIAATLLLCCFATHAETSIEAGWTPLFNGKDLTGWTAKPGGEWSVVDGAIVGTSEKEEKRHGLLVSEKAYRNFTVKLKFKVTEGNSGFYFRSTPVDKAVGIKGFQAEVDRTSATGGLYETLGRRWVKKPDPEVMKEIYKAGEWTDMTVYANGGTIRVSINGKQVVELEDDKGAAEGHFALQLHGGQKMHTAFKDIYIREIEED
ncbi:MAG: 3-keto-disaccharide hydrolase [Phycisphaeraceae bacterium]